MRLIYNLAISGYGFLIKTVSLFNSKARLWVKGRQNIWLELESFKRKDLPLYWFHCASLGEFEQGRPLMEGLRQKEDCQIVVSFFSPSGYEVRKNYEGADLVFYLPLDTKSNASKLINTLRPTRAFFIKYEFWANYIAALKSQKIEVFLVSGLFRSNQIFFKWYGGFFRKVLEAFNQIYVQNNKSAELLKSIGVNSVVSGDTRFDRVMRNAQNVQKIPLIEAFLQGEQAFVVGSSWSEDDNVIFPLINSSEFTDKVIIAPHEINESRLEKIEQGIQKKTVRYSLFSAKNLENQVLIIDNIGMLMNVYAYAKIAYVGGGFRTGLHNILEPACFGVNVMFGPNHQKFPEAKLFMEHKVGFETSTFDELSASYIKLSEKDNRDAVLAFMQSNTGATEQILKTL